MGKTPSKSPAPPNAGIDEERIISILLTGYRQDLVTLIVPSHDQRKNKRNDQPQWANAALELFAELYRGATAFNTYKGIFKTETGEILVDEPILIECYVVREVLTDRERLTKLLAFAKRMGKEMNQNAVGLIVNDVFHEIDDFA